MDADKNDILERDAQTQTVCLMVLAAVAVAVGLYWLRPVLLPFVLAIFFVSGLAPVLDFIEKHLKAPRLVAVGVAFVLGVMLLLLLWLLVWVSVGSLLENAEVYRTRLAELVHRFESYLPHEAVDTPVPATSEAVRPTPPGEPVPPPVLPTETELVRLPSPGAEKAALEKYMSAQAQRLVGHLSAALLTLLSSAVMVLIFMFFLLLGGSSAAFSRQGVWHEIEGKVRGYIVTKTVISVITGGVFGIVLWFFGIPLSLVFALLAFLLNYIPNIGPIIACLLPLPLIVLSPDLSVAGMIAAIVIPGAVQFVSGNIIEPKIMGDSFELHPVAILLTLMFWGMIWGIVGMFLAVPITAAAGILLDRFDHTRPIAELLKGRFDSLRRVLGDAP